MTCGEEIGFFTNKAAKRGGAISARESSHIIWTGEVIFANNSAGVGGALDILLSSSIMWTTGGGTTFLSNIATCFRGGLNLFSNSSARWGGKAIFEGNSAFWNGGGYSCPTEEQHGKEIQSSTIIMLFPLGGDIRVQW